MMMISILANYCQFNAAVKLFWNVHRKFCTSRMSPAGIERRPTLLISIRKAIPASINLALHILNLAAALFDAKSEYNLDIQY